MQNLFKPLITISFGILLLSVSFTGFTQKIDVQADLLLADSLTNQQIHHHKKKDYIYKNQTKTFKNSNPVSLIYGGSLYVYQNFITQHFSASCLFHPSCSEFSKQVVKEYGIFKGGLLSFDRLNRCNRISATDLDKEKMDLKTHKFDDSVIKYK